MCNLDYAEGENAPLYEAQILAPWARPCDDCGRTIAKGERHEVIVWAEYTPAEVIDEELRLPAGDLLRRRAETRRAGQRGRPFMGGRWSDDLLVEFTRGTEETSRCCLHCLTAARWVREVCGGLLYATACWQLAEHWDEDTVYRCRDLARLVLHSGARFDLVDGGLMSHYCTDGPIARRCNANPWTDRNGQLIPLATIDRWVDGALAKYRSTLPLTVAA